ncbi:MAG TPA: SDR family NAD(P)-dependent oxidoreductase [Candidatus Marinimicrobia bacterium]|nr:SDR family NAD(P)-dependent oxidoreductase [Candidatus Neomarinimicrobiota bacterium]
MKKVVITGVSTGIGYSSAKILCDSGYRVFGSVRKQEDAEKVTSEFGANFTPLIFDVTDSKGIQENAEIVKSELLPGEALAGLVNNAGVAMGGPINLIDTDVFRQQFEVNFFGLIEVTKTFLPMLGAVKNSMQQGKIINISSISGRRAHPFVAPYTASKFAVEAFSDALRREMLLYGVDVILIEPGPIKTAIWDKVPDLDDNEFTGTDYEHSLRKFYKMFIEMGKKGFDADIIGNRVKEILQDPSPKTRHVITPNRFINFTLPGILPDRMFDKLVGKGLGLLKK